MFELITPLSYWFLSALWLSILVLYILKYNSVKIVGGAVAVLLTILAIDAFRTTFESLYFGLFFNSQFGLLPGWIHTTLAQPHLLIIPKVVNIIAGLLVLTLLIRRWIPREIRERQDAEEKLEQSQAQLLDIAANVPGVVFQFVQHPDGTRHYPYVSAKMYELFGLHANSLMQDAELWFKNIHPDERANLDAVIDESATTLRTMDWTGRIKRQKDGQWRWIRATSNPRRLDGKGILWNGVVVDITQEKLAADQLQQSEQKYRALFNDAKDMIHIIDTKGVILEANPIELEKMGYSREEYLGKNISEFLHPDCLDDSKKLFQKVTAGEPLPEFEMVLMARDGREIPVEVSATLIYEDGEVVSIRGILRDMTERRKNFTQLQESAESLRASFDQAAVGIAHTSLEGKFLRVNQKLCEMTGYPEAELKALSFYDITHPDDLANSTNPIQRMLDGDIETHTLEKRYVRKDGSLLWVNLAISLSHYHDGTPKHFISVMTDISDRIAAEQALAHSERELRVIMDNLEDTFYRTDLDGNVVIVSPSVENLIGYRAEEIYGKKLADFYVDEKGREGFLAALSENGGHVLGYEAPLRHRDGSAVWVSTNSHYAMDFDGNVIGVEGIARNITRRKQQEEELNSYRLHLEELVKERTDEIQQKAHIIDQVTNPIVSTSLDGIISGWNKAAEDVFGYTADEAVGRHVYLIHPEEVQPQLEKEVIDPLQERGHTETDLEFIKKNGARFIGHLSLSLNKDIDGNPVGRNGYIVDITDRKAYELALISAKNEAETANRAKSEFLSRMSHELRTPMNAILGFAQLMEMQSGDKQVKNNAHEIVHAGRHLLELINEILDLSHIESGNLKLSLEPVSLDHVIEECLAIISPLAEERHIGLTLDGVIEQENIFVFSDATRLKQVILNLLSNAVKYNKQNGQVRIAIQHMDEEMLRLSIDDTGPGLTEQQQSQLFQPFERLGAEHTIMEGTGIGLIICKHLMELMGGAIGVRSTPGRGSTFWIDIRLSSPDNIDAQHQSQVMEAIQGHEQTHPSQQHTILYIEDNLANLRLVEEIIAMQEDLKLLCAARPRLGLELASAHQPELILLDINLPDMDGFEVLKQLRNNPSTRHIPVIAVTAYAMPKDHEQIEAAGFDHYLSKPLNVTELMQSIHDILKPAAEESH